MSKPKFNKKKCLKCKYHGIGHNGYPVRLSGSIKSLRVYCNYSITGSSCLKPISTYKTTDIRGEDYDNCLLFSPGEMIKEDV